MVKKSSDNPDAMLGYSRQAWRALYHLISTRKDVFLEKHDDVSVLNDTVFLILEQIKDKDKKLTATSDDFFKTLLSWAKKYKNEPQKFCADTKCILYQSFNIEPDLIIQKVSEAKDDKEANDVYELLLQEIQKTQKQDYIENMIKLKTEFLYVISHFKFEQAHSSPGLENETREFVKRWVKDFSPKEDADFVTNSLIGWFLENINKDRNKQKHEIKIFYNDFLKKYSSLISSSDEVVTFTQKEDIPENEEKQYYVKQLELLNLEEKKIQDAIYKYLSWIELIDKNVANGKITQNNLNSSYGEFHENWDMNKNDILLQNQNLNEEEIGKLIYYKSLREKFKIQGVEIKNGNDIDISKGVCSYLSNKEVSDYEIGWHPRYKELIK